MKAILSLLFSLAFLAPQAAHAMRFSLVGAANMSEPKTAGTTNKASNAFGYGALLEFVPLPFFGFEIGALSLPRKYEYDVTSPAVYTTKVSLKMIEVPLVLKAYLGHAMSVGIGGYWAKYKDSVTYENIYPGGSETMSTKTLSDAGNTATDFGLVTSLGLYFPLAPLTRIIVDGRYTLGVKDNDPGAGTKTYNDIQLLAGIRISF
jgi:hypothetical protein